MRTLVLASQSPRRKELLERAGFSIRTLSVNISEFLEKNVTLEEALVRLARRKSEAALASPNLPKAQDILVLTADTIVALGDEVFGKPETPFEAVEILGKLSGKTHRVMTAVGLFDVETKVWAPGVCTTKVEFRNLSGDEIRAYVATGDPMDKAGAYAIQGEARKFVCKVDGPIDNVVGLPVDLVERLLKENGWIVARC